MRNLLTFSASALVHSFIAVSAGFLLLTEPKPQAKTLPVDVLSWQWVEEAPPPPPVVEQPVEISEPPPPVKEAPAEVSEPPPPTAETPPPKPVAAKTSRPITKPKPRQRKKVERPQRKKAKHHTVKKKNHPPRYSEPAAKPIAIAKKEVVFPQIQPANHGKESKTLPPPAKSTPRPVVSANALAKYKSGLRAAIERNKRYPRREQRMGVTGTAVVAFQVEANGQLNAIRLARSSGNSRLDAAAQEAVKAVGRYLPPPTGQPYNTSVTIGFVLR